jgi:hypothetical protein
MKPDEKLSSRAAFLTRGSCSEPSSRVCRTGSPVHPIQALLLTAITLIGGLASAQTPNSLGALSQGQPVVAQGTGTSGQTALSSPIVLDATQFTSASGDACNQISQAITQMMISAKNGVVDARGFTGDQKCASNMFGTSNPTGKLLLGNVVLHVSVTQVQPPLFQVEGVGWEQDDTSANTVIRACTGVVPNCSGALGNSPPVLWCWGKSGSCGTGNMTTDSAVFGSFTQYALFDCNGLPSCVAMQAHFKPVRHTRPQAPVCTEWLDFPSLYSYPLAFVDGLLTPS